MKKLLLALILILAPAAASAQCNGVFPNNTACGNITGASNTPRAIPLSSFPANAPGGLTGNVQTNGGGGTFAGITNTQLTALINPFSAILSGAVPASGGSSTILFLNQAGGWTTPPNCSTGATGLVPATGGGTANFLRADCTFAPPPNNYQPVFNITQSPYNAKCNFGFKSDITMAAGSTTATSASGWSVGDVGKYINVQGAGANSGSANTVITNGTASIATAGGNPFSANQFVTFNGNVGTNIIANTAYYVSSVGLSGAAFQVATTPGGTPLVPNGNGSPVAFTSGNLVTTIAAFVNSTTVTLGAANTSGTAATLRQAEQGTDDGPAISAAIAAANAAGGGTVYIPPGYCLVSQINFTNVTRGVTLKGEGISASTLEPLQVAAYNTSSGQVLDLTGSEQIILENFQIGFGGNLPLPSTGIFMAQVAANQSNRIRIRGVYVTGQYQISALYDYGVPSGDFISSDFYNYNPGPGSKGAAYLTASNAANLTSTFATVATGTFGTSDLSFFDCEFHKFAGTGADNWVVRLDGTSNISWFSGVINGGATAYVFFDNTVAHISFFNTTFENEGPATVTTPTNAFFKNSGTVTDLNDPGSSYGNSGAKFNPAATTSNLVTNAQ